LRRGAARELGGRRATRQPGLLHVCGDLADELLLAAKRLFVAEAPPQLDHQPPTVELALEVEQVGLHASLGAAGTLDGVVDYSTPEFLGIRTPDGLYRFFGRNHYGSVVGMSAHLFVDGVEAAAHEAALKAWLDGVYA